MTFFPGQNAQQSIFHIFASKRVNTGRNPSKICDQCSQEYTLSTHLELPYLKQ